MPRRTTPSGFTLLELMVVVTIVAALFTLVPLNMDTWGSRSRLSAAANSLVAAFSQARTQAIYDGWPAYLELGRMPESDPKDEAYAFRIRFTSQPANTEIDSADPEERRRIQSEREREREDLWTDWNPLPKGIVVAGVSEAKGEWRKLSGEKSLEVGFTADGNISGGVAVRLEAVDLDVKREYRTATVMLNPLTSTGTWMEGEHDLERKLPASEFGR
jgi:prepilin-type N-terminal cleavage/methylation domain-containing protein